MDSINDIISSLSSEDIDSLKTMAQSLFGDEPQGSAQQSAGTASSPDGPFSPDMLMKIYSLMNKMNSPSSSGRYKLLEALKPNLSKERQKKADEAMRILKVLEILPMITELYKGGENNAGE